MYAPRPTCGAVSDATRARPSLPASWARRTASAFEPRPEPRMTMRMRAAAYAAPAARMRRMSPVVLKPALNGKNRIFAPTASSAAFSVGSRVASV